MTKTENISGAPLTIYLAGDSTMQSFEESLANTDADADHSPAAEQAGWGQMLMEYLGGEEGCTCVHRESSPYPQQRRYLSPHFIVDNCAMAGRSSKTFKEEGRLTDIERQICPGDYLVIQFGHNDASKESKPERYVPVEHFKASLQPFVDAAFSRGAVPILVSSIAVHPEMLQADTAVGTIGRRLPAYAKVMEEAATEWNCPYLDMGRVGRMEIAESPELAELYLADGVHLTRRGAGMYAQIFSKWLIEYQAAEQERKNG